MELRDLKPKDAELMLEWMHDDSVVHDLHTDFASKTIEDCIAFIEKSRKETDSINKAIVSDRDEYMGTVSLKNIDFERKTAEFAITVRKTAMGCGYSWFAMKKIFELAFDKLAMNSVYWCVSRNNKRAIRFYDKHNFHEALDIPADVCERYSGVNNLKWYSVLAGDLIDDRNEVADCRIMHIKTIPTVNAGELSFFEGCVDIPFEIKRLYYISKVPEGTRRGFHAHKRLKQIIFCPYGRIQLILDNGEKREEIELSDPSIGVIIEQPTWREMLWLQNDSVLCVAASDYYDAKDYIRNYAEFINYINKETN